MEMTRNLSGTQVCDAGSSCPSCLFVRLYFYFLFPIIEPILVTVKIKYHLSWCQRGLGGGVYAVWQTTELYMKKLNKTESLIFILSKGNRLDFCFNPCPAE